jgi:hypothetical protein
MKINEVITEKERVDEVLPLLVPAAIAGGKALAGHFTRHAVQHGLKKLAGLGAKVIKKAPPTPGDGSELDKTTMVPGPQAYHKQVTPPEQVARPALPQGKMSPEANAAIAQVQQARLQKKRQRP